ncbi:MAG: hypothetical protein ACE5R6_11045 [Candidatus Heimdallarchaeota archaeon]
MQSASQPPYIGNTLKLGPSLASSLPHPCMPVRPSLYPLWPCTPACTRPAPWTPPHLAGGRALPLPPPGVALHPPLPRGSRLLLRLVASYPSRISPQRGLSHGKYNAGLAPPHQPWPTQTERPPAPKTPPAHQYKGHPALLSLSEQAQNTGKPSSHSVRTASSSAASVGSLTQNPSRGAYTKGRSGGRVRIAASSTLSVSCPL